MQNYADWAKEQLKLFKEEIADLKEKLRLEEVANRVLARVNTELRDRLSS